MIPTESDKAGRLGGLNALSRYASPASCLARRGPVHPLSSFASSDFGLRGLAVESILKCDPKSGQHRRLPRLSIPDHGEAYLDVLSAIDVMHTGLPGGNLGGGVLVEETRDIGVP